MHYWKSQMSQSKQSVYVAWIRRYYQFMFEFFGTFGYSFISHVVTTVDGSACWHRFSTRCLSWHNPPIIQDWDQHKGYTRWWPPDTKDTLACDPMCKDNVLTATPQSHIYMVYIYLFFATTATRQGSRFHVAFETIRICSVFHRFIQKCSLLEAQKMWKRCGRPFIIHSSVSLPCSPSISALWPLYGCSSGVPDWLRTILSRETAAHCCMWIMCFKGFLSLLNPSRQVTVIVHVNEVED